MKIVDAHKQGPTGKILARCTVFTDGVVRWGLSMEGSDCTGIKVTLQPFYEGMPRRKLWRLGFYPDKQLPVWWGSKHRDALMAAMRARTWDLRLATNAKHHEIIEGNEWSMPGGYAGML